MPTILTRSAWLDTVSIESRWHLPVPTSEIDLFADEVLTDRPVPAVAVLLDQGSALRAWPDAEPRAASSRSTTDPAGEARAPPASPA